jgi:hypothetical protein
MHDELNDKVSKCVCGTIHLKPSDPPYGNFPQPKSYLQKCHMLNRFCLISILRARSTQKPNLDPLHPPKKHRMRSRAWSDVLTNVLFDIYLSDIENFAKFLGDAFWTPWQKVEPTCGCRSAVPL